VGDSTRLEEVQGHGNRAAEGRGRGRERPGRRGEAGPMQRMMKLLGGGARKLREGARENPSPCEWSRCRVC
jgi:hypothetical protein